MIPSERDFTAFFIGEAWPLFALLIVAVVGVVVSFVFLFIPSRRLPKPPPLPDDDDHSG